MRFYKMLICSILICSSVLAAGCSSLAEIKYLLAFGNDQQKLLHERVNVFNKAVYWGSLDEASRYVAPEIRSDFYRQERKIRRSQRLVEIEIQDVMFESNSKAEIEMQVRYYVEPRYIVMTRMERQVWEYNRFNGGWFLTESEKIEMGDKSQPAILGESAPLGRP